jgi:hypothetical protein
MEIIPLSRTLSQFWRRGHMVPFGCPSVVKDFSGNQCKSFCISQQSDFISVLDLTNYFPVAARGLKLPEGSWNEVPHNLNWTHTVSRISPFTIMHYMWHWDNAVVWRRSVHVFLWMYNLMWTNQNVLSCKFYIAVTLDKTLNSHVSHWGLRWIRFFSDSRKCNWKASREVVRREGRLQSRCRPITEWPTAKMALREFTSAGYHIPCSRWNGDSTGPKTLVTSQSTAQMAATGISSSEIIFQ